MKLASAAQGAYKQKKRNNRWNRYNRTLVGHRDISMVGLQIRSSTVCAPTSEGVMDPANRPPEMDGEDLVAACGRMRKHEREAVGQGPLL